MTDRFADLDEFALLHEDAAEFGIPWNGEPGLQRLALPGRARQSRS